MTRRGLLTLPSLALAAPPPPRSGYFAGLISAMRVEWPKNETIHIVAHGHSVPAGYFKTPAVQTFDAYPHLFHRGLKERFPHAVVNMIVTAKGGEDSVDGAARFERDVLALRPKLVLIDYGLNDRRPGLSAARASWTEMIRKCMDRDILLMLFTPTGDSRIKDFLNPDDPLSKHATQIRALAEEYATPLVDSHKIYQDYVRGGGKITDLLSQVNHPNRQGHERIAAEMLNWFPAA